MMIPDINDPSNPLFISTSMLSDLFFAFKYKHPTCFGGREDIVAAAALLTINYFNGYQTDAILAVSIKNVSIKEKDCSDETFLLQYALLFSKIILPRAIKGDLPDNIQRMFIEKCLPVIYKAINNSMKNAKNDRYPNGILEYVDNFVKNHNYNQAVIKSYIDSHINNELYNKVGTSNSQVVNRQPMKKSGCLVIFAVIIPLVMYYFI